MTKIPGRLTWAVEKLRLTGDEAILEIGCGRGVAVSLIRPLLRSGSITAIDRSATAIDAARSRSQVHVDAGRAVFCQAAIEDFDSGGVSFDVIFAVNVNLFWLNASTGFDRVRSLLARNGSLFLFYEPPSPAQRTKISAKLAENIHANGFRTMDREEADVGGSSLLGVVARPAG